LDEERQGKNTKANSIQQYEPLVIDACEDRLNSEFFWKTHIRLAREFGFIEESEKWRKIFEL
jgi:hypothetical protein